MHYWRNTMRTNLTAMKRDILIPDPPLARVLFSGTALQGFWAKAAAIPAAPAKPAITYDWYRAFIQYMLDNGFYSWFAPLVAVGEFMIGVALILGAFVGIAAFFGALLNWNFIMAG